MNPFDLDATGLLVWGWVAHWIGDWLLQNDWMAKHKFERRERKQPVKVGEEVVSMRMAALRRITTAPDRQGFAPRMGPWWDRHPAAWVHAGVHGVLLLPVFGSTAALIALVHLVIDTRSPLVWWSELIRQTQPVFSRPGGWEVGKPQPVIVDIGTEVRFWTDQTAHLLTLAVAALIVGGVT